MTASKEIVSEPSSPLADWQPFISKVLPASFGEHYGTVMSDALTLALDGGELPESSLTSGMEAMEQASLMCIVERDGDYILHRVNC